MAELVVGLELSVFVFLEPEISHPKDIFAKFHLRTIRNTLLYGRGCLEIEISSETTWISLEP